MSTCNNEYIIKKDEKGNEYSSLLISENYETVGDLIKIQNIFGGQFVHVNVKQENLNKYLKSIKFAITKKKWANCVFAQFAHFGCKSLFFACTATAYFFENIFSCPKIVTTKLKLCDIIYIVVIFLYYEVLKWMRSLKVFMNILTKK